jgi:hypothetical protein
VDAHTLHRRGWSISAIVRHMGHDRKTIRAYLQGGRVVGQRRRAEPDPFEPYAGYCRERLGEDPHLWATTLFDELLELGYDRSYRTFTRQLRARGLRALPPRRGSVGGGDRAPAGRGVPVRLAGAARSTRAAGLGPRRSCWGGAGALRAVAWGAGRVKPTSHI